MSKIKFESRLLFADNGFTIGLANTVSGPELTQSIELSAESRDSHTDAELSNVFLAKQYDGWTEDISDDLRDTTGLKGEPILLQSVRAVQVAIIKTAATVTGSVAIAIPQFGITTGTLNIGNMAAALAATPIGGAIHILSGYNAGGMSVGSTNLTVDFTSPVGFAIKLLAVGDFGD